MSAGRDVRGIKRGHQFDKVEMVKFVRPGDVSDAELLSLLDDAETSAAGSASRTAWSRCAPATSRSTAAMKYDVEVWAPGCGEWLEVSSCSNFRDFQARRANIRYRPAPGAKPELVHTLNGSGLALPRVLIAVLETYQRADGSVAVPEVLRPYVGADVIAARRPHVSGAAATLTSDREPGTAGGRDVLGGDHVVEHGVARRAPRERGPRSP